MKVGSVQEKYHTAHMQLLSPSIYLFGSASPSHNKNYASRVIFFYPCSRQRQFSTARFGGFGLWVRVRILDNGYHNRFPNYNPNLNHNPNRNITLTPTLTPNSSVTLTITLNITLTQILTLIQILILNYTPSTYVST